MDIGINSAYSSHAVQVKSGLPAYWLDWLRGKRLRILTYHSISDSPADRLAICPERFAAQMEYLDSKRFQVISLEQATRLLDTGGDLRRKIVITFDDGFGDFLTSAAPILARHGFTAILFVVFGRTGGTSQWHSHNSARRLLSADDLREVKAMGFSLGSHTMTHADLLSIPDGALSGELAESRAALAAAGERFAAFAYPGGRFTGREVNAVARAGYDCAAIVGGRWGNGRETNRFLLKREPILASDSLDWFARRVGGYYEWHYLWARARGMHTR